MRYTRYTVVIPAIRFWSGGVLSAALAVSVASLPAHADEIQFSIDGGRVTLITTEAVLADVLAEWSRLGQTRFVGGDTLDGGSVSVHLVDVAEAEALSILLRSAPGYVAVPRATNIAGASTYDRVTILATRRTPPPEPASAPLGVRAPPASATLGGAATFPNDASLPGSAQGVPQQLEILQRLLNETSDQGRSALPPTGESEPPPGEPARNPSAAPLPGVFPAPGELPRWRRDRGQPPTR